MRKPNRKLYLRALLLVFVSAGAGQVGAVQPAVVHESRPTARITVHNSPALTVEEYRVNGQLRQIKVRPRGRPAYVLPDFNSDGSLDTRSDDFSTPLSIPHWTLSRW